MIPTGAQAEKMTFVTLNALMIFKQSKFGATLPECVEAAAMTYDLLFGGQDLLDSESKDVPEEER